jgi:hypothetical protein
MKANGFARTLVFGALAGIGWPAFALVATPIAGGGGAISLYVTACAALYAASLAKRRLHGIAAMLVVVTVAMAVTFVTGTPGGVALGAAIGIGVARSALLQHRRTGRAIAVEIALVGGGLALARFVAAPGALGTALALWSFFLVQSAWFLIGGAAERTSGAVADRFEEARRRALALLEADP